ncbi:MAG: hypothetical protein WD627_08400 [Actinomycetota bacterium]
MARKLKSVLLSLFKPEEGDQIAKAQLGMGSYDLGIDHKAEW